MTRKQEEEVTRYLHLTVTFLDIQCHANRGTTGEPEWPPSPLRLFQAMVAGCHWGHQPGTWTEADEQAFRWLESQQPPTIVAPDARTGSTRVFHPPHSNYTPGPYPSTKGERPTTTKLARPVIIPEMCQVHYLWPVNHADLAHAHHIAQRARRMTSLGWGIDHVVACGRVSDTEFLPADIPGTTVWKPTRSSHPGALELRVPTPGTLDSLQTPRPQYSRKLHYDRRWVAHRTSRYWPHHILPRHCATFILNGGPGDHVRVAAVAAMMRHLAISAAANCPDDLPGGPDTVRTYIAGHVPRGERPARRFSYLPLPTIGHPHADGSIRRVIVAEHPGGDGLLAEWALWKLHGQCLVDERKGRWAVLIKHESHSENPRRDGVLRLYTGMFRCWRSVTPVLLPGHDDSDTAKAANLVLKALEHDAIGSHLVESVWLQKAPFWHGSHHPAAYFVPAHLQEFPRWHVEIVFKRGVAGPLSIGAGRHAGLGLMAGADNQP